MVFRLPGCFIGWVAFPNDKELAPTANSTMPSNLLHFIFFIIQTLKYRRTRWRWCSMVGTEQANMENWMEAGQGGRKLYTICNSSHSCQDGNRTQPLSSELFGQWRWKRKVLGTEKDLVARLKLQVSSFAIVVLHVILIGRWKQAADGVISCRTGAH